VQRGRQDAVEGHEDLVRIPDEDEMLAALKEIVASQKPDPVLCYVLCVQVRPAGRGAQQLLRNHVVPVLIHRR
jgi:hypothetical protein